MAVNEIKGRINVANKIVGKIGNSGGGDHFIKKYTKADGIITTKPALIKRAKELGLYTILRLFVIDSMAYENIEHQLRTAKPDLIEVLPALMPKVLSKICKLSSVPVIAGGLVSDKDDVMSLLQAGVVSISSTNEKIWFL